MDKECINALLEDIEKSQVTNEKVNLMAILLSDLVKSNLRHTDVIDSLKENLKLASKAQSMISKGMIDTVDLINETKDKLTLLAKTVADLSEPTIYIGESITNIYKTLINQEKRINKTNEDVYELYLQIDSLMSKL